MFSEISKISNHLTMVNSSESNLNCFEVRYNNIPLMRKHDDDEDEDDVSDIESTLRRIKQPKKTMQFSSSSTSKMIWTKTNELLILKGILEYEKDKEVSYGHDWDAFYCFIKDSIDENFSKRQLMDKVKKLKRRFRDNYAKSIDGNEISFTNNEEEKVFRLSMTIWAKNETQPNDEFDSPERVSDVRMEKEEDGLNELYVLQDALTVLYPTLSENQHKFLCQDLQNYTVQRRKELTDEWKILLDEETKLNIKKQTFSLKLTNGGGSA